MTSIWCICTVAAALACRDASRSTAAIRDGDAEDDDADDEDDDDDDGNDNDDCCFLRCLMNDESKSSRFATLLLRQEGPLVAGGSIRDSAKSQSCSNYI